MKLPTATPSVNIQPATAASLLSWLRHVCLAMCVMFGGAGFAAADVRVGINLSVFPDLVPVPGYPVYYAPGVGANFFFYEGDYWLYDNDGWYTSPWYDGPWEYVHPDFVPVYILRIPVRYYRAPPPYFWGWHRDSPPRWGRYWGPHWEHNHRGWDHWDRHHTPRPAPLPTYQREYGRDRYPDRQRQRELRDEHYRYRPQDGRSQHYREPARRPDRQQLEPTRSDGSQRGWQRAEDRRPDDRREARPETRRNEGRRNDERRERGPMRDVPHGQGQSAIEHRPMAPEPRRQEVRQEPPHMEPRGNGRKMEDRGGGERGWRAGRDRDEGASRGRDH